MKITVSISHQYHLSPNNIKSPPLYKRVYTGKVKSVCGCCEVHVKLCLALGYVRKGKEK